MRRTTNDIHSYSPWRNGGWYVHDVRYPSGAIGCVSCNYEDKKWRIVCGDHDKTYPSRKAAADAEMELARVETNTTGMTTQERNAPYRNTTTENSHA